MQWMLGQTVRYVLWTAIIIIILVITIIIIIVRSQMQWMFGQTLRYVLWTAVTDLMLFFLFQQVAKDGTFKLFFFYIQYIYKNVVDFDFSHILVQ